MAMITCPNCGEQVSDKAKKCVNCGMVLIQEEKKLCSECGAELEAGYFMGYLGRENTIIIADENVEIPGDLSGMVYTTKENWEFEMLKELNAAGMKIDMNKLLA